MTKIQHERAYCAASGQKKLAKLEYKWFSLDLLNFFYYLAFNRLIRILNITLYGGYIHGILFAGQLITYLRRESSSGES